MLANETQTIYNNRICSVLTDVSSEKSVENMISEALNGFSRIDILINCAAIQSVLSFDKLTFKEWKRVLNVNLDGTFLCCKHIAGHFKKNKSGNIINFTSIHDKIPRLNKFHYDASKAAVSMFTRELALEMAAYGVRVNGIAPGAIETEMNKDVLESNWKKSEVIARIPMRRMGNPDEVADLVMFLISEKAKYITGEIISIDGGRHLR